MYVAKFKDIHEIAYLMSAIDDQRERYFENFNDCYRVHDLKGANYWQKEIDKLGHLYNVVMTCPWKED